MTGRNNGRRTGRRRHGSAGSRAVGRGARRGTRGGRRREEREHRVAIGRAIRRCALARRRRVRRGGARLTLGGHDDFFRHVGPIAAVVVAPGAGRFTTPSAVAMASLSSLAYRPIAPRRARVPRARPRPRRDPPLASRPPLPSRPPVASVLGCMTMGWRYASSECDDDVSAALMRAFVDAGHSELDTARAYAGGDTEKIMGRVLASDPDLAARVSVATKANPWPGGNHDLLRRRGRPRPRRAQSPGRGQPRRPRPRERRPPLPPRPRRRHAHRRRLAELVRLRDEGAFRRLGLSNFSAWETVRIHRACLDAGLPAPDTYQGMYNCVTRAVEPELIPALRQLGMRFLSRSDPLAGGVLTGKHLWGRLADPDGASATGRGRFTENAMYQDRFWQEEYFDAIDTIAAACRGGGRGAHADVGGVTMALLALRARRRGGRSAYSRREAPSRTSTRTSRSAAAADAGNWCRTVCWRRSRRRGRCAHRRRRRTREESQPERRRDEDAKEPRGRGYRHAYALSGEMEHGASRVASFALRHDARASERNAREKIADEGGSRLWRATRGKSRYDLYSEKSRSLLRFVSARSSSASVAGTVPGRAPSRFATSPRVLVWSVASTARAEAATRDVRVHPPTRTSRARTRGRACEAGAVAPEPTTTVAATKRQTGRKRAGTSRTAAAPRSTSAPRSAPAPRLRDETRTLVS